MNLKYFNVCSILALVSAVPLPVIPFLRPLLQQLLQGVARTALHCELLHRGKRLFVLGGTGEGADGTQEAGKSVGQTGQWQSRQRVLDRYVHRPNMAGIVVFKNLNIIELESFNFFVFCLDTKFTYEEPRCILLFNNQYFTWKARESPGGGAALQERLEVQQLGTRPRNNRQRDNIFVCLLLCSWL